jgi:hypothetical protein
MFTVYDQNGQPVTVSNEADMEAMIRYCGYRRALTDPIVASEPEPQPSFRSRKPAPAEE